MFQNTGAPGHSEEVGRLMNLHSCWTPDPKALRSMDARDFMTWRSPCLVCGRALKRGAGIFCSNFLRKRKFSRPCLAAWCGECYVPHPEDPFPIQDVLEDEEENEDLETGEKLELRFRRGRNGDHIMGIPFECDLCHFRNVARRDPVDGNPKDEFTLMCIRRASLDAMWSREASTVSGNLNRLRRDYDDTKASLSIAEPLPVLGRDDVSDRVGMGVAVSTLNASLRKGKYAGHLQYDSMRKTPTAYNNAYEAGEEFGTGAVFSNQDKKSYETHAPTGNRWFTRFMLGAKRRMGVIRKQDEALTVEQLLGVAELAEMDWQKSKCESEKKEIESMMAFVVIGFCLSLRGEEVPLTVIEGLLTFWEETKKHKHPHMMVTLKGKFKGEQNLRWHCVPLAD